MNATYILYIFSIILLSSYSFSSHFIISPYFILFLNYMSKLILDLSYIFVQNTDEVRQLYNFKSKWILSNLFKPQ